MGVLVKNYDYDCNICSPVAEDYYPVNKVDEKGNTYKTYEKFDAEKAIKDLGNWEMWSLRSLINAGIDPKFRIKTGFSTNLELENYVNGFANTIENANKEEN